MPLYREAISTAVVTLPRRDLAQMVRLVRALYRLSRNPAYRSIVLPQVPEAGRFDPGHDAVMMGYDFHLNPEGPRLIEVNTNAGGALLAYLSHHADVAVAREALPRRLKEAFLASFAEELKRFGGTLPLRHVAIIDDRPRDQYLYREMTVFAEMFESEGIRATIADPADADVLTAGPEGVTAGGEPVDLIYNRHCDFYLEGPQTAGIRAAYLAGTVCLTPNPFAYGLLADKRRLALWSDPEALCDLDLSRRDRELFALTIPESRLLSELDREALWRERKRWVFKPVSRFGSRGVLLGPKISRARFDELDPADTLVQRLVPPSLTPVAGGEEMKTDLRLYVYRDRVLGVAARLYRGQVTNLRTAGGGFAPVRLERTQGLAP